MHLTYEARFVRNLTFQKEKRKKKNREREGTREIEKGEKRKKLRLSELNRVRATQKRIMRDISYER